MFNGLILRYSVPLYFVKAGKPSAITKHKFKAPHILYFDSRLKSASHYSCFSVLERVPCTTGQKAWPVPDHV